LFTKGVKIVEDSCKKGWKKVKNLKKRWLILLFIPTKISQDCCKWLFLSCL
jgi:hypothetical protein